MGYTMRGGHWLRCRDCRIGAKNSVHKDKLAFDINLTLSPSHDDRPRLLTGKSARQAHAKLHDYWDLIGGAKRIENDFRKFAHFVHYLLKNRELLFLRDEYPSRWVHFRSLVNRPKEFIVSLFVVYICHLYYLHYTLHYRY